MVKHYYRHSEPFQLESGAVIEDLVLAYHTAGTYDPERNNVIWICHAFTANSDPTEWWEGLVGEGKFFNAEEYFIVCVNMIGSCYGTTGPLSIDPSTGRPYYRNFPLITIRDLVRSMQFIKHHLEITRIRFAVGFSMGGQKLLEWIYEEGDLFQHVLLGATNAFHSPWGIAFNESQRMAIAADTTFGEPHEKAGLEGMAAARSIGLISYRNYLAYLETQKEEDSSVYDNYKASSYQQYQGEKLKRRFNAYSYWTLSKAMDSHNMARGRTSLDEVLGSIQTRVHLVGISSDYLFPVEEQQFLREHLPNSVLSIIDSHYGHDGFLIEYEKLQNIIKEILG
jgi:homoserine O-acetyltransferase